MGSQWGKHHSGSLLRHSRLSPVHSPVPPVNRHTRAAPSPSPALSACTVARQWNESFDDLRAFDLLYATNICLFIGLEPCPRGIARHSAPSACAPRLISVDYTSGRTISTLPFNLPATDRLDPTDPTLLLSSDQQHVISTLVGNTTTSNGTSFIVESCTELRAAQLSTSSLHFAWSDRQCINVTVDAGTAAVAQPASTVFIAQGVSEHVSAPATDLVLWFDQSEVVNASNGSFLSPASHVWRVYSSLTGELLSSLTTDVVVIDGYGSILQHGAGSKSGSSLLSILVSRWSEQSADWNVSMVLYELSSEGRLTMVRDITGDWSWDKWRALGCQTSTWVMHDATVGKTWRGVDVMTGKQTWTVSDDSILSGQWPVVGLPDEGRVSGIQSWHMYTECAFSQAHPYDSSLFVASLLGLNRTTGEDDVMYGLLAIYDANSGNQLAVSAPLGPAPILDHTVYCNQAPQPVADGSAILIVVEQMWFALHPTNATTMAHGLLPLPSVDPNTLVSWQLLSVADDHTDRAAALLLSSRGWIEGTTISSINSTSGKHRQQPVRVTQ